MRAPRCVRRRRLLARFDAELEQLRAACAGAGLAVAASTTYNPRAVGTVLGLDRRIRNLEARRGRVRRWL